MTGLRFGLVADKPSLVERIRAQRERHRTRSQVIRVPVAAVGFAVLVLGVALLALPGPGLLVIVIGLAILALEFAWAERTLERAVRRLDRASERAAQASPLGKVVGLTLTLLGIAAVIVAAALTDVPVLPF